MEKGDTDSKSLSLSKVVYKIKQTFNQVCQVKFDNSNSKPDFTSCNDHVQTSRKRLSSEMPLDDCKKMKMDADRAEHPAFEKRSYESIIQNMREMAVKRRNAQEKFKTTVEWRSGSTTVCPHIGANIPPYLLNRFRSYLSDHKISFKLTDPQLLTDDNEIVGNVPRGENKTSVSEQNIPPINNDMIVNLCGDKNKIDAKDEKLINCPICNGLFPSSKIEIHGNECASLTFQD